MASHSANRSRSSKQATASLGGAEVTIDAFVSVPYWEFFLQVTSDGPAGLVPSGAELLGVNGRRIASANDITSSLERSGRGTRGGDRDVSHPAERRRSHVASSRSRAGRRSDLRIQAVGDRSPGPGDHVVALTLGGHGLTASRPQGRGRFPRPIVDALVRQTIGLAIALARDVFQRDLFESGNSAITEEYSGRKCAALTLYRPESCSIKS